MQEDSLPAEPPGKPKNTGVCSLSLLQQIFPTLESNWGLLQCRWILYQLSSQGISRMGDGQATSHHAIIGVLYAQQEPWGHKAGVDGVLFQPTRVGQREVGIKAKRISNWEKRKAGHMWTGQNEGNGERFCVVGFLGDEDGKGGPLWPVVEPWLYWGLDTEEQHSAPRSRNMIVVSLKRMD